MKQVKFNKSWRRLSNRMLCLGLAIVCCCNLYAKPLDAAKDNLVIGVAHAPSSLDPHFQNTGPNVAIANSVFETLFKLDRQGRLIPCLVSSFRQVSSSKWVFTLRHGVMFHDGEKLTTKDVLHSFNRVLGLADYDSPFRSFLPSEQSLTVLSEYEFTLDTVEPIEVLKSRLSKIFIVKHDNNLQAKAAFDDGSTMIGTGPYEFVNSDGKYSHILLQRNEHYWGERPDFRYVTMNFIADREQRITDFLDGKINVLEKISPIEETRLRSQGDFQFSRTPTQRCLQLHLDSYRDETPFITLKKSAKNVLKNPLKNRKVRQAMSLAIDRQALVKEVMQNAAAPTMQLVASNNPFANPMIQVEQARPEMARRLLAEAGYPNGFNLVMHCTNDRYINDGLVCSAVADMFSKVGITTTAVTLPKNEYFPKMAKFAYSVSMLGWEAGGDGASEVMRQLVMTLDTAKQEGMANIGRYSSSDLDAVIQESFATSYQADKVRLIRQAAELIREDYAVLPLYFEYAAWATWPHIRFKAQPTDNTLAQHFEKNTEHS